MLSTAQQKRNCGTVCGASSQLGAADKVLCGCVHTSDVHQPANLHLFTAIADREPIKNGVSRCSGPEAGCI
jgi:hypothetical protein